MSKDKLLNMCNVTELIKENKDIRKENFDNYKILGDAWPWFESDYEDYYELIDWIHQ